MWIAMLVLSLLGAQMALAQSPTVLFADRTSVYAGEQVNVSVFYYDSSSGWSPLPGAEVLVGEQTFITDVNGKLTLTLDEPGTYDLVATKNGFTTSEKFTLRVLPPPSEKPTPERKLQNPRMLEMGGAVQRDIPRQHEPSALNTPAHSLNTPAFGVVVSCIAVLIVALRRM